LIPTPVISRMSYIRPHRIRYYGVTWIFCSSFLFGFIFVRNIVDLTTVGSMGNFQVRVVTQLPSLPVAFVPGDSFLFTRFLPYNIMHLLHDDLLGVYFTLQHFFPPSDLSLPYNLSTRIVLADEHPAAGYAELVQLLSDTPVFHHGELPAGRLACYESIVAGTLKRANWYQYGFGRPQGPIPGKQVSGSHIREFANFVLSRAGLPHLRDVTTSEIPDKKFCVYSRTRNRLIINEREMAGEWFY